MARNIRQKCVDYISSSCTVHQYRTEINWLQGRKSFVGSSDAASVLGIDPNRGPYAVWFDKTTPVEPNEFNDLAYWGHSLEPNIAARFMAEQPEARKWRLVDLGNFTTVAENANPFFGCTPDRLLCTPYGKPVALLELKTAHFEQAKIWAKEVPARYMAQICWARRILGVERAFIAVLANGRDFAWHEVFPHRRLESELRRKARKFWRRHVQGNEAPRADGRDATRAILKQLYTEPEPQIAELPDDYADYGLRWDRIAKASAELDKQKNTITNQVKQAMENCELAELPDGSGFSWRGDKRRTFKRHDKKVRRDNE